MLILMFIYMIKLVYATVITYYVVTIHLNTGFKAWLICGKLIQRIYLVNGFIAEIHHTN